MNVGFDGLWVLAAHDCRVIERQQDHSSLSEFVASVHGPPVERVFPQNAVNVVLIPLKPEERLLVVAFGALLEFFDLNHHGEPLYYLFLIYRETTCEVSSLWFGLVGEVQLKLTFEKVNLFHDSCCHL